jgi:hypothetical protein
VRELRGERLVVDALGELAEHRRHRTLRNRALDDELKEEERREHKQDGKRERKDCQIRLVRDGIVVHEGMLASLQRFKDSVKEVASGYECGLSIEKFNDIKEGDVVEAFTMEEIPQ